MITNIFDSHAHYDDARFDEDRHALLTTIHENGVKTIMTIGADMDTSHNALKLSGAYDFIYCAVGIHPQGAPDTPENYLDELKEMAKNQKVKAIGEIGLDYYWDTTHKEKQKRIFREQLTLAKELDLPVVIHSRDATEDTMEIIREYRPRGVVHCYSGSLPVAQELISLGMYLGFTGVITFKNAKKAVEVVAGIPLDRLLVETDCPYMAPEPNRGRRCDSGMLEHIITKIAEIKGVTPQEIANITTKNAELLFGI